MTTTSQRNLTSASIFIRCLVIGALYAVTNLVVAAILGPVARQQFDLTAALMYWISGTALSLTLAPFALRSSRSPGETALAIWGAIAVVRSMGTGIEGALFRPAPAAQTLVAFGAGILIALALAWLIVKMLPAAGDRVASPLIKRPWLSWVWRVLLVGLAYLVFYFVFGSANALLYTLPFYRDNPQYGLNLPPMGTILIAELIRGPLFAIGALILARLLVLPRRRMAIWLGLALWVLGGFSPFVENTFRNMPLGFNLATIAELFLQNFSTGLVAAALYLPRSSSHK